MRLREVKLIRPVDVIERTPLRGSLDNDNVNPMILLAQDTSLVYVLGRKLMEHLQKISVGVEQDETDGRYRDLLEDFIEPFLVWETALLLIPTIAYSMGQNGLNTPETNQGVSVFESVIDGIKKSFRGAADAYKKKLVDHLCENQKRYEYYRAERNFSDEKASGDTSTFSGIEFY